MPTIKEIAEIWKQCDSIRETASHFGISQGCVRKALITEGLYSSPIINRIAEFRERGLKPTEIAEQLGVSLSTVNANLPYEKGTYLNPNKTKNALKIRESRERKKNAEQAESKSAGVFRKYVRLNTGERGILIRVNGDTATYRFEDGQHDIGKEDIENGWD